MHDLPSLNGLRAFEAVARGGSVKAAAAELYVTPGAVSQQIKGLEDHLGLPLFRRRPGGLQLNEAGAALYPDLRESFAQMYQAVQRVRQRERTGPLTVSVVPSFAARWLVPRLGLLRERHPEIDVRIAATTRLADFTRDDVDVAIRLGSGQYPGLQVDFLFRTPQFPVCSPSLQAGARPIHRPEDLRHHTLLHDEHYDEWVMWLELHGVGGIDARRGLVFSDASMALQAAIDGQGVAMGRRELVARDLAEGRLVRLFGLTLPRRYAYYVVTPPAVAEWPKVAAFRQWLLDEARREVAEQDAEQDAVDAQASRGLPNPESRAKGRASRSGARPRA